MYYLYWKSGIFLRITAGGKTFVHRSDTLFVIKKEMPTHKNKIKNDKFLINSKLITYQAALEDKNLYTTINFQFYHFWCFFL